jgi:hypothetical protein
MKIPAMPRMMPSRINAATRIQNPAYGIGGAPAPVAAAVFGAPHCGQAVARSEISCPQFAQ